MKTKRVLCYIGVGLIGVVAGAMIFSPETRGKVIGGIKSGKDWVAGKLSKKEENTCGDEVNPEPENEEPAESKDDHQRNGGKRGNWKPYYNKKNNN